MKNVKKLWAFLFVCIASSAMSTTVFGGQWVQDSSRPAEENSVSNWKYQRDDGTWAVDCWEKIDSGDGLHGINYCFNEEGYLYVSREIQTRGQTYSVNELGQLAWPDGRPILWPLPSINIITATEKTGDWEQDTSRAALENGVSNWRYRKLDGTYATSCWEWIDRGDGFGECFGFNDEGYLYESTSIPKISMPLANAYFFMPNQDSLTVDADGRLTKAGFIVFKQMDLGKNNLSQISDQEACNRIMALKSIYPEGMHWTNDDLYYKSPTEVGGGCAGFAYIVTDGIFGISCPQTTYDFLDWDKLRVGDTIRYDSNGSEHSVIVLSVTDSGITVAEGNYNSSIHYGRRISRSEIEDNFIYRQTCY